MKWFYLFMGLSLTSPLAVQADTINNEILIVQSRDQYECSSNGVQPNISGSVYKDGYCFIPISEGKCVAYSDPFGYSKIISSGPSGMTTCTNPDIITDEATNEEYYRFFSGTKFVLEQNTN